MTAASIARETHLPAAVIDPRLHAPEIVKAAARVVPDRAHRVTVGSAQLGYRHKPGAAGRWRFGARRLHEIERLISLRYDGPCDTDDGEAYLAIAVNLLVPIELERAAGRPDPLRAVRAAVIAWSSRWLPLVTELGVLRAVKRAIEDPRIWRADSAANQLRIVMAERQAANITTMGAIDADRDERERLRKQRHAEAQRARRAAERNPDGQTREAYEMASVAAECRRLGISRSTYYRRQRDARAEPREACDRLRAQHKEESYDVAHATCVTPPIGPPGARAKRAAIIRLAPPIIDVRALRRIDGAEIIRLFAKATRAAGSPAARPPVWSRWRQ